MPGRSVAVRVVVVGATGNVGTSVVMALGADSGVDEIVGLARRLPDWAPPKTRFVAVDVSADPLAGHFAGADAVVHLAWLFQPTHRPNITWRANVLGSIRVFEAVTAAGVPALVHASSIGAYSPGPPDGRSVDESWPTHSLSTAGYGREKAYVERILDIFERDQPGTRVVRFRPAFTFKRASATSQRRLFMGPFVPNRLVRPGRVPVLPYPHGLRLQALHTEDVADAYRRAVTGDARGAFNLAADPVLDGPALAEVLGARLATLPRPVIRAAVAAAWHARLVPADPNLFDLAMELPVIDPGRAHAELGWTARHSAQDAIAEMLEGLADGAGGPTAPLAADRADRRLAELGSGVGQRP